MLTHFPESLFSDCGYFERNNQPQATFLLLFSATISLSMLCVKFSWNWQNLIQKKFLKISSVYFCYFVFISPWKWTWPFIWTNLTMWFLRRRWKCEKFTDRRTTGDQKNSLKLSAQVSKIYWKPRPLAEFFLPLYKILDPPLVYRWKYFSWKRLEWKFRCESKN